MFPNPKVSPEDRAKFMSEKEKEWIVVFSCVDKPRSKKQISEIWGYASQSALSQKGLTQKLFERGLVQGEFKSHGEMVLSSNLDWMFEYLFGYYYKNCERDVLYLITKRNYDFISNFVNENRDVLFGLDNLLILFKGDKSLAVKEHEAFIVIPINFIIICSFLISFKEIVKKQIPDNFGFIIDAITGMTGITFGLNVMSYSQSVMRSIDFNKIPKSFKKDVLNTMRKAFIKQFPLA